MRRLARFLPDNVVTEDIRVFLLQSSTTSTFNHASVKPVSCHQAICFEVDVAGSDTLTLGFEKSNGEYTLINTAKVIPGIPDLDDNDNNEEGVKRSKSGGGGISLLFLILLSLPQYYRHTKVPA